MTKQTPFQFEMKKTKICLCLFFKNNEKGEIEKKVKIKKTKQKTNPET